MYLEKVFFDNRAPFEHLEIDFRNNGVNVLTAINTVMKDEIYLSSSEKKRLGEVTKDQKTTVDAEPFDLISTLSDRQLQVFTLIGKGIGTVEIAEKLNLSIKTIDTHKENIKTKLHLSSSAELRQMAIEWTKN